MQVARYKKAFTVVELLIGLLITSILLSAVATLAFALSTASTASGDTAVKQAQIRQATLRISDLVGACQLICAAPGHDLVVWRADDNPADNRINVNELVYIERGENYNMLRLCQFNSLNNRPVELSELALVATKAQWTGNQGVTYTSLIPECKDVAFAFYPAPPPLTHTGCVMISLTLTENGADHRYEIVTALRSRAGHLLNKTGDALVETDDD